MNGYPSRWRACFGPGAGGPIWSIRFLATSTSCLWYARPSVPMRRDTCAVGIRVSDSPRLGDGSGVVNGVGWVSGLVVLAAATHRSDVEREMGVGFRCSSAFTRLAVDVPYHALTGFQRTSPYRVFQNVGVFWRLIHAGCLDLGVPMSNNGKVNIMAGRSLTVSIFPDVPVDVTSPPMLRALNGRPLSLTVTRPDR